MRRKKVGNAMKRIISAMLAVLIILSGCSVKYKDNDAVIGTGEFLGEFNPLFAKSDGDRDVCSLVFDSLVEIGETGDVISSLANWEVLDEGLRYRFKIQRNASFSDGTPLLAEDVLFSLKLLTRIGQLDLSGAGVKGYAGFKSGKDEEISGFELSDDDKSFSITLEKENKNFLKHLTFGIISRNYYEKAYESEGFQGVYELNHKPVGSGQYVLARYEKGMVTLTANKNYFKGMAKIDHLTLKSNAQNEFDILETYQAVDILKNIEHKEYSVQNVKNGDFYILGFNCKNTFLSDGDIRRAIKFSTDREKISENISGSVTGVPSLFGVSYLPDLKKAEEYLEKAGFTKGEDGIYEKNKKELTLKVLMMKDTIGDKVFALFEESMKNLGVKVSADYEGNLTDKIDKGQWDLYLLPLKESSAFLSADAFRKGNIYSFENSDFDKLKGDLNDEMCKIISEEVPVLPLYEKVKTVIYHSNISGINPSPYKSIFNNMFRAQIEN